MECAQWDEMFSVEWNALDEMQIRILDSLHSLEVTNLIEISSITCPDMLASLAQTKYLACTKLLAPVNPADY